MLKLEDLKKNAQVDGLIPEEVVRIVNVDEIGSHARLVVYRNAQGTLGEQTLFRSDEHRLSLATAGCAWAFDAAPESFKLALEAYRISLAHLFDPMMAVHTSHVEPLPHQIAAVYEAMLPRQPLRFVLADDPGAGKTIMAGLLIKELAIRGDVKRCLIVCPGVLAEQWQDELGQKFGLRYTRLGRIQEDWHLLTRPNDPLAAPPKTGLFARREPVHRLPSLTMHDHDKLAGFERARLRTGAVPPGFHLDA